MRNSYSYRSIAGPVHADHSLTEKASHPARRAREIIDTSRGAAVVEFGMPWGEHCRVVEPLLASVFALHADVQHVKIAGNGRRLSKLFNIKYWPTLIFLFDGKEVARLVRPNNIAVIEEAFAVLTKLADADLADSALGGFDNRMRRGETGRSIIEH